ncbi:MAG: glycosyltransferase [Cytophagales bacterium]|nr:glycosyltransferase [Cytophagales bacterium]
MEASDVSRPYFSVIIPTHNRKISLTEAVQSVLNQSFNDFEVRICDDASGYPVKGYLTSILPDNRIYIHTNTTNSGPAYSRNRGLEQCTGKYICFLDDDDLWLPNHLQSLYDIIQKYPQGILYYSNVQILNVDNNIIVKKKMLPNQILPKKYFYENPVTTSAVCIRHETIVEKKLQFQEDLRYPEDYLFWMCVSDLRPWYGTGVVTVTYRVFANSLNLSSQKVDFITNQRLLMLQKIFEYYANNQVFNKTYGEVINRGVYIKIVREYLNNKEPAKSISYLHKLIKLQPYIIVKQGFVYIILRYILFIFKSIFRKDCCK